MHIHRLILPAVLAALAGCSSTKLAEPTAPVSVAPATAVQAPAVTPAAPAQPAQTTVKTVTLNPLDDPKSGLAKRSVYFDFDSFAIHDADRPLIETHARFLASNHGARVRLEGNADERGGSEYNLALGQKRAEAVLKALQLLGAPAGEMEAISFGKEKPVDPGHDEAAWAKNRRADLHYVAR